MHDSSAMPSVHLVLLAILLVAVVAFVVTKRVRNRTTRQQATDDTKVDRGDA
jgi:hypothetical protein